MNTVNKNTDKKNKYYTIEEMIEFMKKIPELYFCDINTKYTDNQILNDMNDINLDTMKQRLENFPDDEQYKFLTDFINLFEGNTKYYILNRLLFIYDTEVNLYRRETYAEKRYIKTMDTKEKTRILCETFNELKHIENLSKIFDYFLQNELPTNPHKTSPDELFQMLLNADILLFNVGRYTRDVILDGNYKKTDDEFSPNRYTSRYKKIIFSGLDENTK